MYISVTSICTGSLSQPTKSEDLDTKVSAEEIHRTPERKKNSRVSIKGVPGSMTASPGLGKMTARPAVMESPRTPSRRLNYFAEVQTLNIQVQRVMYIHYKYIKYISVADPDSFAPDPDFGSCLNLAIYRKLSRFFCLYFYSFQS